MCQAWADLGFGDMCGVIVIAADLRAAGIGQARSQEELAAADALPPWLGDEALHLSHRSAVVRKDPVHHRSVFLDVLDDLPCVWPAP